MLKLLRERFEHPTKRILTQEIQDALQNDPYAYQHEFTRADTQYAPQIDLIFKFTLSALWNISDESPITCEHVINLGGLEICLQSLDLYNEDALSVKTFYEKLQLQEDQETLVDEPYITEEQKKEFSTKVHLYRKGLNFWKKNTILIVW